VNLLKAPLNPRTPSLLFNLSMSPVETEYYDLVSFSSPPLFGNSIFGFGNFNSFSSASLST